MIEGGFDTLMLRQTRPNAPGQNVCQVLMYDYEPCGRKLVDPNSCILHSRNVNKDAHAFDDAIEQILSGTVSECFDFTRVVFHISVSFSRDFEKPAYFFSAEFLEWVYFNDISFQEKVVFHDAVFSKRAQFHNVKFLKPATFNWCEFRGSTHFHSAQFADKVEFSDAKFVGRVEFLRCEFSGEAIFTIAIFHFYGVFVKCLFHTRVDFSECDCRSYARLLFGSAIVNESSGPGDREMFKGEAKFYGFVIRDQATCIFESVSVENCSFYGADVDKIEFQDVDWPVSGKWFKRKAVFEETGVFQSGRAKREWCNKAARTYQLLQVGLMNRYDFHTASDFYIGEQEMKRKAKGWWGRKFSTSN